MEINELHVQYARLFFIKALTETMLIFEINEKQQSLIAIE